MCLADMQFGKPLHGALCINQAEMRANLLGDGAILG